MNPGNFPPFHAQQKLVDKNTRLGNRMMAQQQGTTVDLIDAITADGTTDLKFFSNAQNHVFPYSNLNSNRLEIDESLAIQGIAFGVITHAVGVELDVVDVQTFEDAGIPELYAAHVSISISNSIVVKPKPIVRLTEKFSPFAKAVNNNVLLLDVPLVIPAQTEFEVQLRCPTYTAVANAKIFCLIYGPGAIQSIGFPL